MEKQVKARKNYQCAQCDQPILKGDLYNYIEGKAPRYADDGHYIPIGIKYYRCKVCINCVNNDYYGTKQIASSL